MRRDRRWRAGSANSFPAPRVRGGRIGSWRRCPDRSPPVRHIPPAPAWENLFLLPRCANQPWTSPPYPFSDKLPRFVYLLPERAPYCQYGALSSVFRGVMCSVESFVSRRREEFSAREPVSGVRTRRDRRAVRQARAVCQASRSSGNPPPGIGASRGFLTCK